MIARHVRTRSGVCRAACSALPAARAEERETAARALELLELVGLADRAEERARNFPYGDQRRLEIARALALEPELLLLDEPAAGMNPSEKRELSDIHPRDARRFDLTVAADRAPRAAGHGPLRPHRRAEFRPAHRAGRPAEVQNNPAVIEAYLGN